MRLLCNIGSCKLFNRAARRWRASPLFLCSFTLYKAHIRDFTGKSIDCVRRTVKGFFTTFPVTNTHTPSLKHSAPSHPTRQHLRKLEAVVLMKSCPVSSHKLFFLPTTTPPHTCV